MTIDRAYVVVDLGFGDAGKGRLTDFLVRTTGAQLVVRFNGGAQAGHNVVDPDGRHHTFAQFGAGSFVSGTQTFLSRYMLVHPTALLVEARTLEHKQCGDVLARMHISEQARLITPFHQAANRLRELARGSHRHGSCGVGVGETVQDDLLFPTETIRAGELTEPSRLRAKLRRVQERKRAEIVALGSSWGREAVSEFAVLEEARVIDAWIEQVAPLAARLVPDAFLSRWSGSVVCEGAQGVLLDETYGFHPYTTWSRCTPENALELLREGGASEVQTIGVLRSHAVRHGPGPLPTEDAEALRPVNDHNAENLWQGRVRYGHFDAVLARYAIAVSGGIDTLALTHLDALRGQPRWRYCSRYRPSIEALPLIPNPTLEQQEQLARQLEGVTPELEDTAADAQAVIERVEELLGRSVGYFADGPTAPLGR